MRRPTAVAVSAATLALALAFGSTLLVGMSAMADPGPSATIDYPTAGSTISDPIPSISGTAAAYATVSVFEVDESELCATAADAAGAWNCAPSVPLDYRSYDIVAQAQDGTAPPVNSDTVAFAVEAPAPVLALDEGGPFYETDGTLSFSGTTDTYSYAATSNRCWNLAAPFLHFDIIYVKRR